MSFKLGVCLGYYVDFLSKKYAHTPISSSGHVALRIVNRSLRQDKTILLMELSKAKKVEPLASRTIQNTVMITSNILKYMGK